MRIALLTLALAAGCALTAGHRLAGAWELVGGDEETELDWFDAGPAERERMRAQWREAPARGRMVFGTDGRFSAVLGEEESEARYTVSWSGEDTAIVRFDPDFGAETYSVFELDGDLLFFNRQYVLRRAP